MVGLDQRLLDKFAVLRDDLDKKSDNNVIMEKALKQAIAQLESDPETASTAAKQAELRKVASGESTMTPRQRQELFADNDDEEANLSDENVSDLQKKLAKRIFKTE